MGTDTVSAQLKKIRKQRKLTQAMVALRAGLSRVAYSNIETRRTDPSLASVSAICDALGLDLLVVPKALRSELDMFIASGGRYVDRPPGLVAPKSRVG